MAPPNPPPPPPPSPPPHPHLTTKPTYGDRVSGIKLEQLGKVKSGVYEDYYVRVHLDDSGQQPLYYIFLLDDLDAPTDGGDFLALDLAEVEETFRQFDWEVEWLDPL